MNEGKRKAPDKRKGTAQDIVVFGVVQGVGFRPFVFRLAHEHGLKGWVKNAGTGVEIHLECRHGKRLPEFLRDLELRKPPFSRIERMTSTPSLVQGFKDFKIRKSGKGGSFVFISPDISVCRDCLEEIHSPGARRYAYPFTNCTNCGPRYTIVKNLPYDRPSTTMAAFPLCPDCAREYADPMDRRFHAQPIACPVCGPRLSLIEAKTGQKLSGGIPEAAALIQKGKILAVKGIGGFHLVCDPLNAAAVRRLRRLKARAAKPLALMAKNLETVSEYALLSSAEKKLLCSAHRPIVLLTKKRELPGIAPGLQEIGFMLPYSPLHELLLEPLGLIVATSSNRKDAPIMKDEAEGLPNLCDFILTHDRPIEMRSDDSVLKAAGRRPLFVRRARGYVPMPQPVPEALKSGTAVAALGGELKDTISLYKDGYVITSQFLGDLDDYRNFRYFEETLAHLERLFGIRPDVLITDLHPDFRTTRFAQRSGLIHFKVQHHFAHVLAPLLEHGVPPDRKVLGVAFDGFGYGADGTAWGGEFLIADYASFLRMAHFQPVALPGADLASRQPWRMALSYMKEAFGKNFPLVGPLSKVGRKNIRAVQEMLERGIRSPLSSSCGRLFDAVSFVCGTAPLEIGYEAEAAMKLEAAADMRTRERYPYRLSEDTPPFRISFAPAIRKIVADMEHRIPSSRIAAKFHNTLAQVILDMANIARKGHGIEIVSLAGGCFLNKKLLLRAEQILRRNGFTVLRSEAYSPNDESLSLGQIAHALVRLGRPR